MTQSPDTKPETARAVEPIETDYLKYRGKCKEMSEALMLLARARKAAQAS